VISTQKWLDFIRKWPASSSDINAEGDILNKLAFLGNKLLLYIIKNNLFFLVIGMLINKLEI
jgi:hypothetical protein